MTVVPDAVPHRAGSWLIGVLCVDGAGVAGLMIAAAASGRPPVVWMAVVAAAGFLFALAGVPTAARRRRQPDIRVAQFRVTAGLVLTAVGAALVLASFPSVALPAGILIAASVVIGAAYLVLLRRLKEETA